MFGLSREFLRTHFRQVKAELRSPVFPRTLTVASISALLGASLYILDHPTYVGLNFLVDMLPELLVFNGFMVFAGLVASFRTAHALVRYTDAAGLLHQMHACWFDTASTLFAFCRASRAGERKIQQFQHTLVRLVSALNAMCFEELTIPSTDKELPQGAFKFEVIDMMALDEQTQHQIADTEFGPELIFQAIQQLVVDSMHNNSDGTEPVLSIAPPILTRSFQELGSGLLVYHEARKLANVPLPWVYSYISYAILVAEAMFAPFQLANATKGPVSSFFFAFFATFLLWFLNGMADQLNNPFQKAANTLDMGLMQHELNLNLIQLMAQTDSPLPEVKRLGMESLIKASSTGTTVLQQHSLAQWKRLSPAMNLPNAARLAGHVPSDEVPSSSPGKKVEGMMPTSLWEPMSSRAKARVVLARMPSRSLQDTAVAVEPEILTRHSGKYEVDPKGFRTFTNGAGSTAGSRRNSLGSSGRSREPPDFQTTHVSPQPAEPPRFTESPRAADASQTQDFTFNSTTWSLPNIVVTAGPESRAPHPDVEATHTLT